MSTNLHFLWVMAAAVLSLGLTPLFEKLAVSSNTGLHSVVLGVNLASLVFLAVPGWSRRPVNLLLRWRSLLLVGGVASGLVVFLNLWALETTSATHRSVFQALYPAATALFAYFLLAERLPLRSYLVIAVMVAGTLLMSTRGLRWEFIRGDLLLMLTVPLMGLCDAWAKATLNTLHPQWVALGRFFFGTLVLVIFLLITRPAIQAPTGVAWVWITLSGLSIAVGINMLYRGMQLRGAALAAGMLSLAPVVTLTAEWLWLSATFQTLELAGMVLVLTAGFLLTRPDFQAGVATDTREAS